MPTSIDTSAIEEAMQKSWGKMTLEQLLTSLIILVVCLIVVKLVMTLLRRITAKSKMDERVRRYILGGIKAILYVVTILIVAQSLGIPVTSLIALVSVFGLAVSLAIQDVLSNVAGGMVILFSKPFTIGDYVETTDGEGEVVEISLTHTKLDTYGGQRVMLPNKEVVAGKIINYSARGIRRVDHAITASYDDSTEAVLPAGGGTDPLCTDGPCPRGGGHRLQGQRRGIPCAVLGGYRPLLGCLQLLPGGNPPLLCRGRRHHDLQPFERPYSG